MLPTVLASLRRPLQPASPLEAVSRVPWHGLRHVEGLRAVAAGAVFVCHLVFAWKGFALGGLPGQTMGRLGSAGVVLFFGLSGFLLFGSFIRADAAGRHVDLRSYFQRRITRIGPAYWVALLGLGVTLDLAGVFSASAPVLFGFGQLFVAPHDPPYPGLGVAWTLTIEVAFYLMLPALAGVVLARGRTPRGSMWMIAGLIAIDCIVGAVLTATGRMPDVLWVSGFLGPFSCLLVGMALALLFERHADLRLPPAWVLAVACAASFAVLVVTSRVVTVETALAARPALAPVAFAQLLWLIFCGSALALVLAPARRPMLLHRALGSTVMVFVGSISYGIYLWHAPLQAWLSPLPAIHGFASPLLAYVAIACALTLAVASASWLLLERPLMIAAHRRPLLRDR